MAATVERERKWLVRTLPEGLVPGTPIRQGYLSGDGLVTVRIRQKGSNFIGTVKAGAVPSRVEVEWALTAEEFDALWPYTTGKQVSKVRHEHPIEVDGRRYVAEVDVFDGHLTGLLLVEIEFETDEELRAFEAPGWFGTDVTFHGGYGNGTLAVAGLPPDHPR